MRAAGPSPLGSRYVQAPGPSDGPASEVVVEGDNGTMELTNDYMKLYLYKAHKNLSKEWTTIHKIDLPSSSRFEIGAEGLYEEDQDFIRAAVERAGVAPADVARCFAETGLEDLVYRGPVTAPWPTLGEMVARDERVSRSGRQFRRVGQRVHQRDIPVTISPHLFIWPARLIKK